jgi:DNA mismatch endonuclease, patch repair protein
MADTFSKKLRSAVMGAVRSHGNRSTELLVIAIFRAHGIKGWRRHQPLKGKPDFVFQRERLAVFVDGCFWHGCPKHLRMPSSNVVYWNAKIQRNMARDHRVNTQLRGQGWTVIRIWEHALSEPKRIAARLLRLLEKRRSAKLASPLERPAKSRLGSPSP